MTDKSALVSQALGYLRQHPEELLRVARNAFGLRVGVPLAALRYLAAQGAGKKGAPRDVQIEAVPPGIRVGATIDAMGNDLRASAVIIVERVSLNADELLFEVRVRDISVKVLKAAPDSPIPAVLQSGMIDLSKPGNLLAYLPKRPPFIVDAKDDRITLDLKKHPKLGTAQLERLLEIVTPLVSIRGIHTDYEHLDVQLQAFPDGLSEAAYAVRKLL